MRTILLFLLLSVFFGCSSQSGNPDVELIQVDFRTAVENFDLSPMLTDDVEVILLETTDESLIGEISDIRIEGDHIYVSDKVSKKIVVFDREGKYLFQIGRVGRGPDEYLGLTSTEAIDGSTVAIFDHFSGKLLYYNTNDGKMVRNRDISKIWAMDIVYMDGTLYFVNDKSRADMGYYLLYALEDGSDNPKAYLPFDKKMEEQTTWGLDRYYSKNTEELLLYFPPYDTLYMMSGEQAAAKYFIDFGPRKVPESVIDLPGNNTTAISILKEKYIKGVDKVHLTDKYILIDFSEEENYTAIYNRETKDVDVCEYAINSHLGGFRLFRENAIVRDGTLITFLSANDFTIQLGDSSRFPKKEYPDPDPVFIKKINTIRKSITASDNPILFIQKFK